MEVTQGPSIPAAADDRYRRTFHVRDGILWTIKNEMREVSRLSDENARFVRRPDGNQRRS